MSATTPAVASVTARGELSFDVAAAMLRRFKHSHPTGRIGPAAAVVYTDITFARWAVWRAKDGALTARMLGDGESWP